MKRSSWPRRAEPCCRTVVYHQRALGFLRSSLGSIRLRPALREQTDPPPAAYPHVRTV